MPVEHPAAPPAPSKEVDAIVVGAGFAGLYMLHRLRQWDRQTANNVDLFIGISHHVRQRIWRTYRRPEKVIYPPVRVDHFTPQGQKDDFYVTV